MRPSCGMKGPGWWLAGGVGLALVLGLAGCNELQPITPFEMTTDPARLYASLTLDHGAVNLSTAPPHNTLRLTATPRNGYGDPIEGLPAPTFRSTDTTRVWVSADGTLEARQQAAGIAVIAELTTVENIHHADTVFVNVTTNPAPPALATLTIAPESPEAAFWPMFPTATFDAWALLWIFGIVEVPGVTARALDDAGNPIPDLAIQYESLDPHIARVDPRTGSTFIGSGLLPIPGLSRPGQASIVARTTAYGVTMADTAVYTVTLPAVQGIGVVADSTRPPALAPAEVRVLADGFVAWINLTDTRVEVTFDDATNVAEATVLCMYFGPDFCGGGDIPAFDGAPTLDSLDTIRYRHFPVPGTYTYRVRGEGVDLRGRVVVVANE